MNHEYELRTSGTGQEDVDLRGHRVKWYAGLLLEWDLQDIAAFIRRRPTVNLEKLEVSSTLSVVVKVCCLPSHSSEE